jgi:hypothetical protein
MASEAQFAVERYAQVIGEIKPILLRHWEEIALLKNKIEFAPDYDKYAALDAGGSLHVSTVRIDGALVGYHVAFLSHHPHYSQSLMALTDIFYVVPEQRRGLMAFRFFQFIEAEMRKLGVVKMIAGTKLHFDLSPLFDRLGWKATDVMYAKYIGD